MIPAVLGTLFGTALIVSPTFYGVPGDILISTAHAQEITQEAPTAPDFSHMAPEAVDTLIARYAKESGVLERSMHATVYCEAFRNEDGTFDATHQSLFFKKDGKPENSWGLSQINLDAHTTITKAQAQDPDFSIRFMAQQFAAGNAHLWTCWRDLKSSGQL